MPEIEYRPVPGFSDYGASAAGEVIRRSTGRIILATAYKYAYMHRIRGDNGKPVGRQVARTVAEAWHGLPPEGYDLHFIDGDHFHIAANNLAWLPLEEIKAAIHATGGGIRGENSAKAKLSDNKVRWIREQVRTRTCADIAHELGISMPTVWAARTGRTWRHVV